MAAFVKESLTLEETNRVRLSLGLKPLEDDGGGAAHETSQARQDAESTKNFEAQRDAERKDEEEAATRARIAKAQNRRALARKLRGPTLGEESESQENTRQWVKAAGRRAKENAARLLRAQEEEEQRAQQTYGAQDLQGLRVAHDLDDLDGKERVLTLRDADVLDQGEDELVDAALDRAQRDRRNKEQSQKPKAYTGLEEDMEDGVLSKYDTDPIASSTTGFRLGDVATSDAMAQRAEERRAAQASADARAAQRISLDYLKNMPVSDYEAPDVGFKKAKKKKRHTTRVKVEPEEEAVPSAEASAPAPASPPARVRAAPDNLVDDDELAASLSRARRNKAKQSIQRVTPEMLARNLAAQKAAEAAEAAEAAQMRAPAPDEMTFDETAEFVRHIGQRPAQADPPGATQAAAQAPAVDAPPLGPAEAPSVDTPTAETAPAEAAPAEHPRAHIPASPPPASPLDDTPGAPTESEWAELAADAPDAPDDTPDTVSSGGVAGALRLLRSQGILEQTTPEQRAREKTQLHYDAWMHAQKKADRQYDEERRAARGVPKDQATRERENRLREKREAEAAMERFKDYTPDVKLEYHDEFGRTLTQKEAWKRLSHVFHGNAPGYKAQEKRLRRIEEEQRRERMLAGDTSTLSQAFQERSARTGQAHMVLSVGNKDHAPQDLDLLGNEREAQLAKTQPKPKGPPKKTKASHPPPHDAPPGLPDPAAQPTRPSGPPPPLSTGGAPDASEAPSDHAPLPPKPGMKPAFGARPAGFAPMAPFAASSAAAAPGSRPEAGAPDAPPREKIKIALGKRKAP